MKVVFVVVVRHRSTEVKRCSPLQTSVQMLSVSAVCMVHVLLQETCLDEGMVGKAGGSIERVLRSVPWTKLTAC